MTTSDLLHAWREATRAADLAERLARLAEETASQTNLNAEAAEEVAAMADQAAQSAAAAAERAARAATEARRIALRDRSTTGDADDVETKTRGLETEARTAYQQGSDGARAKYERGEADLNGEKRRT